MDHPFSLSIPMISIARGDRANELSINKFGYNDDVDPLTAPEDIWDGGGLWVGPTDARIHDIVSNAAADTVGGGGANTIQVEGLNNLLRSDNEIIAMNGLVNVPTVNEYWRIHRKYVLTAGAGGTNGGDITAIAQVDGTTTSEILIDNGQTLMAIFTIPAGMTGFMTNWYASMTRDVAGAAIAQMEIWSRGPIDDPNSAFRIRHKEGITIDGTSNVPHEFKPPKVFEEKTDIILRCALVSDLNTKISGGFDLVLVENG